MNPELEKCLDKLDAEIHKAMIKTAMEFTEMELTDLSAVLDSTGGVVTVLQSRHMHAMVSFLGAMLEAGVPMTNIRSQAGAFKDVFNELVDDAVTHAVCQHALYEAATKEGGTQ